MAQSTNDIFPTAMRVATLTELRRLAARARRAGDAFASARRPSTSVLKSGRTHMQDAVPIRLGQEFAAYALTMRRARARIGERPRASRLEQNIGATAVGTRLNAEPEYIALVIELPGRADRLPPRAPPSSWSRPPSRWRPCSAVSAALRGLAVDLAKIAEDLLLMSSGPRTGFAEISLPATQPGSSIMPGKVNPVMVENLSMICYHVIGLDTAVAWCASAASWS